MEISESESKSRITSKSTSKSRSASKNAIEMITEKMEGGILVMRYKGQRIDPEKR
jgi:hypothetical protein